jgi:hypothetical protein
VNDTSCASFGPAWIFALAIEGDDAFAPSKRCQSCGMLVSFVYLRLTRAPAGAVSWLVSKRIPSP